MKHLIFTFSSLLLVSACHTAPTIDLAPDISGNYVLDPTHASVNWSLSHAGLSNYTARFDDISGTLSFDADSPENSIVDIRIQANSISTGLSDFDQKIAEANDGLSSDAHPEIRFISNDIEITGNNRGLITGDLTIRGVTHPTTLDVTFNGSGKSFGNPGDTLGFSATGEIDRTEWGVTKWSNFGIGKTVTLRIESEFNEKQ